jgi:hypothetical protein
MLSSHRLPVAVVIAALAAAGCGSSSTTTPTLTTPTPTVVTETFNGSITQGGSAVFNFSVTNSGYQLLAAYTSIAPGTVPALGLGIGAWDATNQVCGLNQFQNDTSHSGSTAFSGTAGSGAYCIRAYDGGNIPTADTTATFTIQVQHY